MIVVMKSGRKIEATDVILDKENQTLLVTKEYAVWIDHTEIEDIYVGG